MRKTTNVCNVPAPVARAITMCLCTYALSSCADLSGSEPTNTLTDPIIKIEFEQVGKVYCPKIQPDVCADDINILTVDKRKKLGWQSVDAKGNPIDTKYAIWFDPFEGPQESDSKGLIKPLKFKTDTPPKMPSRDGIVYKYTIVGEGCEERPVDPRFRVR